MHDRRVFVYRVLSAVGLVSLGVCVGWFSHHLDSNTNQARGSVRTFNVDGQMIRFPPGLIPQVPWTISRQKWENKIKAAEKAYRQFTNKIFVECRHRARIGNHGDGGWDVCLTGPYTIYQPCLVYSFGIANDWTFEEQVLKEFGCHVKSFDPTTIGQTNELQKNVKHKFYPVGLSHEDGLIDIGGQKYEAKTFHSIVDYTGDKGRIIDYLKFDIEGSEWSVIRNMLRDGYMSKFVKQVAFEAHTYGVRDAQTYRTLMDILKELEEHGFRRWHISWNKFCLYPSVSGNCFTYCQEMYYLNINFLSP